MKYSTLLLAPSVALAACASVAEPQPEAPVEPTPSAQSAPVKQVAPAPAPAPETKPVAVETEAPAAENTSGTEQPDYEVLVKEGDFELRSYPDIHVARTPEGIGGSAFGRLFRYIDGDNEPGNKVAMTAPVLMQYDTDSPSMSFVLPSKYSADTAPVPENEDVETMTIDAARYATVRFSGRMTNRSVREKTAELRAWIEAQGKVAVDDPFTAGYDPPYTPASQRRNEIWIRVE